MLFYSSVGIGKKYIYGQKKPFLGLALNFGTFVALTEMFKFFLRSKNFIFWSQIVIYLVQVIYVIYLI